MDSYEEFPDVSQRPSSSRRSLLFQLVHWKFVPLLILAAIASSPSRTLTGQYVYQRYAEDAGLDPKNSSFQNRDNCKEDYNRSGDSVQDHVQQESAQFSMYMTIAMNIPSMFTLPMWGALSDIVGRKVPIIAGISGNIVRMLMIVFVILFHWPLWLILLAEAIHGVFGYHTHTILYIASAYIADNGSVEMRTLKMVMVDLWLTVGETVGSLITGYTLKDVGYVPPMIGSSVIDSLLIVYVIFIVPTFGERKTLKKIENGQETSQQSMLQSMKHILTRSFNLLFRAPVNSQELRVLAVIFFITGTASSGGSSYINVYAMGYPLCWRAVLLSVFSAVDMLLHGIAATFMTLLWKRTGWRVELLMVIGIGSTALEYLIIGFAKKTFMMFVAVLAGSFYMLTHSSGRSLGAGLVHPKDQGALMAGLTNAELVSRLLGTTAFNYIYSASLNTYEGIVFFAASLTFMPCFVLLWYLYRLGSRNGGDRERLIQAQE